MQILIELSEEDLDDIKNNDYIEGTYYTMFDAITNGIQLPKGHGRLVDMNEVIKIANKMKDLHGAIWNVPTIIEADKNANR